MFIILAVKSCFRITGLPIFPKKLKDEIQADINTIQFMPMVIIVRDNIKYIYYTYYTVWISVCLGFTFKTFNTFYIILFYDITVYIKRFNIIIKQKLNLFMLAYVCSQGFNMTLNIVIYLLNLFFSVFYYTIYLLHSSCDGPGVYITGCLRSLPKKTAT